MDHRNVMGRLHQEIKRYYYKPIIQQLDLDQFASVEHYLTEIAKHLNDPHFYVIKLNKSLTFEMPYGHEVDGRVYLRLPPINKPNKKTIWESYLMSVHLLMSKAKTHLTVDLRENYSLPVFVLLFICKAFGLEGEFLSYYSRYGATLRKIETIRHVYTVGERLIVSGQQYRSPELVMPKVEVSVLCSARTSGIAELLLFVLVEFLEAVAWGEASANQPGFTTIVTVEPFILKFRVAHCMVLGRPFIQPVVRDGPIPAELL
jgi:hypothetical protein